MPAWKQLAIWYRVLIIAFLFENIEVLMRLLNTYYKPYAMKAVHHSTVKCVFDPRVIRQSLIELMLIAFVSLILVPNCGYTLRTLKS